MNDLTGIIDGLTDHQTDASRPFIGQAHTSNGERGKTEVKGIRFRDLADCVVRAFVDSAAFTLEDEKVRDLMSQRADDGTLNYNDLYDLNLSEMDPIALVQNIVCRVEKAMGIYPNI